VEFCCRAENFAIWVANSRGRGVCALNRAVERELLKWEGESEGNKRENEERERISHFFSIIEL
jgi:hypothetical protein